jgi:MFS family permease
MMGVMALGVIIGPWIAGWIFDTWHSYRYAWWLFTGLNAAALVLLITTPKMRTTPRKTGNEG